MYSKAFDLLGIPHRVILGYIPLSRISLEIIKFDSRIERYHEQGRIQPDIHTLNISCLSLPDVSQVAIPSGTNSGTQANPVRVVLLRGPGRLPGGTSGSAARR